MGQIRNHRIIVARRGGPEEMLVVVEDLPEPGPGEVRLKMLAAGVSAFDVMIRSIAFPGNPKPLSLLASGCTNSDASQEVIVAINRLETVGGLRA